MPLFVMIGRDGPEGIERRAEARPRHLEHWQPHASQGEVVFAGPLLAHEGSEMIGSVIIFDAPDQKTAEGRVASDPYAAEGIFESTECLGTRKVLP